MSERFASEPDLAGRAYHSLFLGRDDLEAEAAAVHMARSLEMIAQALTPKS